MTQLSLTITGADNVRVGLQKLGPRLTGVTKRTIERLVKNVKKAYTPGPVQGYTVALRDGQRYVRTGTLASGMTYRPASGYGFTFVSQAEYSPLVIGVADGSGQAWMHAGRWPLLLDVMTEKAEMITKEMEQEVTDSIEAVGL